MDYMLLCRYGCLSVVPTPIRLALLCHPRFFLFAVRAALSASTGLVTMIGTLYGVAKSEFLQDSNWYPS